MSNDNDLTNNEPVEQPRPQRAADAAEALDAVEETRGQPIGGAANAEVTQDAVASSEAYGRGEGTGEAAAVEGIPQSRLVLNRFLRHRGALFGLLLFLAVALLAFTSMGVGPIPGWWKHDTLTQYDMVNGGSPTMHLPSWMGGKGWHGLGQFPFGQDMVGHDNFAQVMSGVQTSILVMFVMAIVAMTLGVLIGSLAGYYRGWIDTVLMRFTDLVITLPLLVLGAVLGALLNTFPVKHNWSPAATARVHRYMPLELAIMLGLLLWPGLARLTRSEFMRLREMEFVDSARVAGATDRRIIFKHMLPNALGVVIVNVTLLMSVSVVTESALSFLGFGITPPSMSLGNLISTNQAAFNTRGWLFWWPGLFIVSLALAVNFVGDGLRDAFDPRTKRIPSRRTLERAARKHDQQLGGATAASAPEVTK